MIRVIDGIVYEVKRGEGLELVGRELGEHREVVVQRPLVMVELDAPETVLQWWREKALKPKSKQDLKDAAERDAERAQRRRKTEIRRRCKALGCDDLLTGTYRGLQTDLALAWAHWEEFVRRVRRYWPDFVAVVGWEEQKRGAWHWHAAVRKVPQRLVNPASGEPLRGKANSYNVLRAIWRSVTKEYAGNVFRSPYVRHKERTASRIASYIAKYLTKTKAGVSASGHRLWSASKCVVPRAVRLYFAEESLADLIDLAHDFVSGVGRDLCSAWVAPWGDTVFLATEPAS